MNLLNYYSTVTNGVCHDPSGRTWPHKRGWGGDGEMMDGTERIFQPDDLEPARSFEFAVEEFSCPDCLNSLLISLHVEISRVEEEHLVFGRGRLL